MLCYCLQLAVLFISVNLCTSSINNAEFINLKLPCDVFKHALRPSFFFLTILVQCVGRQLLFFHLHSPLFAGRGMVPVLTEHPEQNK